MLRGLLSAAACGLVAGQAQEILDLIADFQTHPESANIRENLFNLTYKPHLAGETPGNLATIDFVQRAFEEAGLETSLDLFQALLTKPVEAAVQLVFPEEQAYNCSLDEPSIPGDPYSEDPDSPPTFVGYAANGDVTEELVFVNYCQVEDFEELEARGIDISGKIAICKYGKNFRGVKVYLAEKRGVVGMVIYSDPADDGFVLGPVYPEGPHRPQFSVQRGSVSFMNVCPGDPTRVEECLGDPDADFQGTLVPSIPVHPLSWGEAQPLLQALGGPQIEGWGGGVPDVSYNIGPGPARVRVYSEQDFKNEDLINVIGIIRGEEEPESYVVLGNHRDAWGFGGVDPSSGTAVLLEVARSLGELMKTGWRPRRSIVLCSWDGEEYALIGSTYWSGAYAHITDNAIAYVNVDSAATGSLFRASGSSSLRQVMEQATALVEDPNTSQPLSELWNSTDLGVLGSGSDYTAFIHHHGVPSLDFNFNGPYGVYHSNYDNYAWMETHGDPGFIYHEACAKLFGTVSLLLSEPVVAPLRYEETAADMQQYLVQTAERLGDNSALLDLDPLSVAIEEYVVSAARLMDTVNLQNAGVEDLNAALVEAERLFLSQRGLPDRPYFKHVLQAPGINLGYGSDVFPGLAEAIRVQDWVQAEDEVQEIATVIDAAAMALGANIVIVEEESSGLSGAGIFGLVLLGMVVAGAVCWLCVRQQRLKDRAAFTDISPENEAKGYGAMP